MNPQLLQTIIDPNSPLLISSGFLLGFCKVLFLIGFGVYAVFAFAVIRQATLMTRSVETGLNKPLMLLSWVHFATAIAVWIFAYLTL